MTEHPRPDSTDSREADRIPAWMTLPGSLAATETPGDPTPDDAPSHGDADVPATPDHPDEASEASEEEEAGFTPDAPARADAREVSTAPEDAPVGPSEDFEVASAGVPGAGASGGAEELGQPGEPQVEAPALKTALEAILLVVDEPVAEVTLAQVLERPTHQVAAALRELAEEYTAAGRGFDLREVAGGWRYYTRADCAQLVERFVRDGQQTRLTQAALETLAVVAYRQPVSRARVAAVRGVNSDGVMRTLVARGLVEEAGTDPESQAVLYRTSSYFLERLGLRDLSELPELAPFLPDDVENLEETTK